MAKATHTGTCQICGAHQKLPNGNLSKHGYTVDYGWFNGTCAGAHGQPFEKGTDLIEAAVEATKAGIVGWLELIEELKTATDYVWLHVYSRKTYSSTWKKIEISELHIDKETIRDDGTPYNRVTYRVEGERHTDVGFSIDMGSIITKCNADKIRAIQRQIVQMEDYVTWQNERVANWKPAALTPIK